MTFLSSRNHFCTIANETSISIMIIAWREKQNTDTHTHFVWLLCFLVYSDVMHFKHTWMRKRKSQNKNQLAGSDHATNSLRKTPRKSGLTRHCPSTNYYLAIFGWFDRFWFFCFSSHTTISSWPHKVCVHFWPIRSRIQCEEIDVT